jgi:ABC-type phosphate transport system permease subunit
VNDFWAGLLGFFSDLILFTGGIVVVLIWIAIFAVIAIESWDFFTGYNKKIEEEDRE